MTLYFKPPLIVDILAIVHKSFTNPYKPPVSFLHFTHLALS